MDDITVMLDLINKGQHLNEEVQDIPQIGIRIVDCTTRDFLDIIRFDLSYGITMLIDESFSKAFDRLALSSKLMLSIADSTGNTLKYFLLTYYPINNMEELEEVYKEATGIEKKLLMAVLIQYDLIDVISENDNEALLEYFVSKKVSDEYIKLFSSPEFIKLLFETDLHKRKTFYVWVCENLKKLLEYGFLDVNQQLDFFVRLFKEEDYIQNSIAELIVASIKKEPSVFFSIINVNLRIDPFTKETNYSIWLKDSGKLMFLAHCLQTYFSECDSDEILKFRRKLEVYFSYNLLEDSMAGYTIQRS
ncbi:hypothetical protein [Vreelandella sulfidaeris]|uniref:hypothetical protein n=1 Tax=Vreelandella sulfidaeris TaxID=115553 RepID=UPI0035EF43A2